MHTYILRRIEPTTTVLLVLPIYTRKITNEESGLLRFIALIFLYYYLAWVLLRQEQILTGSTGRFLPNTLLLQTALCGIFYYYGESSGGTSPII